MLGMKLQRKTYVTPLHIGNLLDHRHRCNSKRRVLQLRRTTGAPPLHRHGCQVANAPATALTTPGPPRRYSCQSPRRRRHIVGSDDSTTTSTPCPVAPRSMTTSSLQPPKPLPLPPYRRL
uniref:Uncharacterized protein n=1 Tax=Oryza sativa subsp. japonica TaxID=39947 RepID=Q5Z9U5_ORYSJ|nr:hypothetical protein [Oryza sativa Japonica Group]